MKIRNLERMAEKEEGLIKGNARGGEKLKTTNGKGKSKSESKGNDRSRRKDADS
jgi:hypothetical protein